MVRCPFLGVLVWCHGVDVEICRYPIFIDVAIQARSKGFLGTQGSTLSLLALRRVHDWHDGLGKLIPWNQFGQHPETLQIH